MGYLLLTTGMRASELLSLQFSHVHETHSMNYIEIKGKRDKWRRIPLTQKSIYLIHSLKQLMQLEGVRNPYLCFNIRAEDVSISYETFRLIAQSASSQLTSQSTSPHWFRRSFITKLLVNNLSLYEVMNISGHESINTTNNYLQDLKKGSISSLPFD